MFHWDKDKIYLVRNWLGDDCNCKFVGLKYTESFTSTTKIYDQENNKYDLILGFDRQSNIYAAWNPYLYHFRQNYSVSIPYKDENKFNNFYYPVYASLKNKKNEYGKKLLILPEFLETFCSNWRTYLKPDVTDDDKNMNKVVWADKYHPEPIEWKKYSDSNQEIVIRDKEIITRSHRDYSFRKRVMEKYDPPQCCICHCSIVELLEAAHIQAVSDKGDDSTENGILLCRNHHKMFDEGMIKIHGDKLEVCDERVKEMPWYKDFVIEQKEKVFVPK